MKKGIKLTAIVGAALLAACSPAKQAEETKVSALLQHEDSITKIIEQMTLEEKVNMLHGKTMFSSAGVERLGIPDLYYADGPFGIREELEAKSWRPLGLTTDSATFFPTGSALAATWDKDIAYQYGKGMAIEAKLRGKDMILGPAMNIQRLPTGGRTYEYLSEDPYLSGQLALGYTLGAQDNGVAVCLKHYALNNQETRRGTVDVQVSDRAMREIYLAPFEVAVREGDAYGVMAAYNKVRGKWCSENEFLLTQVLRDEWGFKGIVISDWGGTHNAKAVVAGLNVEMPSEDFLGPTLVDSVKAGVIPESAINERVRELLRVRLAIEPVPADKANQVVTSQPAQQKISYDVATKSIVLLKNDNHILPVRLEKGKKIAVIGDNATATQALRGIGAGVKVRYEITPLMGLLRNCRAAGVEVKFAQGYKGYTAMERFQRVSPYHEADKKLMDEAVALAKECDLVIFVAGENRDIETEGSDRTCIDMPAGQNEVIQKIAEVNPNIVTVVVAGAPLDLRVIDQYSKALVYSWYNGTEGGHALADVLTGVVSPSGRLPFTLPKQLNDSPAWSLGVAPDNQLSAEERDIFEDLVAQRDRSVQLPGGTADYKEGLLVGYRWFSTKNIAPLYAFGHGLSYATFEYSNLKAAVKGQHIEVSFSLKNTGSCDADEVAQVYVGRPDSKIERPKFELKDFCRVALKAGESKTVSLTIPVSRLAHWDEASNGWKVENGAAVIHVGSASDDFKADATVQI